MSPPCARVAGLLAGVALAWAICLPPGHRRKVAGGRVRQPPGRRAGAPPTEAGQGLAEADGGRLFTWALKNADDGNYARGVAVIVSQYGRGRDPKHGRQTEGGDKTAVDAAGRLREG